ncbi:GNAT family N-acetyltransferase [Clostridium hydrogenum]|uniref:GNAT family N-acetyltransferase n=1 Tax=Clostridium hydrogenum TaxID=2855764 RepID=UPI001F2B48F0|nr:GNAT family N-acetyltransferase [Clostridium hydrogenum]
MSNYKIISNYMENEKYRSSFNELAKNTFDIDFERWYKNKLFFNRYVNYSEVYGDKVIANVSINKMELIIDGQKKKALQLGTVMTQPEYRKKGLSRELISHIIEEYKDEYDLIYLLANDSVLNFYPKFGFKKVDETSYKLVAKDVEKKESAIRKLNTEDEEDKKIIKRLVNLRQPISKAFGVCNDIWPLLVYCFYEFKDDLYYLEDEDTIVILQRENEIVNIYDIVSLKAIDLESIIEKVVMLEDKTIELNFVPELCKYKAAKGTKKREDTTLFVIDKDDLLKEEIQFPITSHT